MNVDDILRPLGGISHTELLTLFGIHSTKVRRVLVLAVQELFVDLLGGHASAEQGGGGEVAAVTRIGGAHHVLCVPHLLRQLRHREGAVLLGTTRRERGEPDHEKVQARERHQVHRELAQVGVELTREAQAARDAGHDGGDQVVQITERRRRELQRAEANIIKCFVVKNHALICVFDELVHRKCGVVRLDDGVRHLGRRNDGKRKHHAIGVLFANLGDEKRTHAGTGTATERVAHLEPLQAVARFSLLAHDVEHAVDQLGAFGVVTLRPVVSRTGLPEHEVIRSEDLTVRPRAHRIHGARLEVHEHGAWHVATCAKDG